MTVGESLTEARYRAGLTVDELSERTQIRGTVIRSIEQDDYAACGGDLYVRGYVRAIAGAVGIDARPLIREFDQIRASGAYRQDTSNGVRHADEVPAVQHPAPDATALDLPPAPVAGDATDLSAAPDATALDLPPVPVAGDATDLPAVPDATALDWPPVPPAGDTQAQSAVAPGGTVFDLPPVSEDFDLPPVSEDFDLPPVSEDPAATRFDLPPFIDPDATVYDLPPVTEDLMAAGYDFPSAGGAGQAAPPSADERAVPPSDPGTPPPWPATPWPAAGFPAAPAGPRAPTGRAPRTPGVTKHRGLIAAVTAVAIVAVAFIGYHLASGGSSAPGQLASSNSRSATSTPAAKGKSGTAAAKAKATAGASAKPAATSSPTATLPPVTSLPIASANAFGPEGLADGDNEQAASNAIASNPPSPWNTDWYATANFGNLKGGTGLLLDLGHPVTITSVSLDLSQYNGVNLQLKAGDSTLTQDLSVVATANGTGGVVRLTLPHAVTARYLLIWFTLLPPNGQGQYQESVYHVLVNGMA